MPKSLKIALIVLAIFIFVIPFFIFLFYMFFLKKVQAKSTTGSTVDNTLPLYRLKEDYTWDFTNTTMSGKEVFKKDSLIYAMTYSKPASFFNHNPDPNVMTTDVMVDCIKLSQTYGDVYIPLDKVTKLTDAEKKYYENLKLATI